MATIVTRSGKGSPLSNTEADANFTNLNTDKLESGDLSVTTTAVGTAALAYSSGVFTYTPPDLSAIDLSLYAPLAGAVFTGTVEAPLFEGDLSGAQLFPAKAGEALTKGDALYISGISGNKPVVMKADANDPAKMPSFGLAGATVSTNANVNCVTYGQIHSLDTTAFSLGDQLYVSTTAGALTSTAPTGETSLIQNLGKVERVHASAGALFVAGSGRANATPNLDNGNFFLGNASNQSVSTDFSDSVVAALSGGSGISLSASGVIANTAPDQTVALTGAGATSISGTYPNFTISSTNTTYSVGDGGLTQINFTSADNTKLDGIAVNANNYTLPFTDNSTNWNTAYGWGNHALAGYLTAEADTLSTVLARGATSTQSITSFDTNGTQFAGLSVGEAFANYDGWNTQLNVHGAPHSRLNVKTSTVRMGVYAHNSWHNISGSTLNGHVGTYTNHGLGFLVNASPKMVINTSGQVGINQTSPTSQLHVGGIIAATGGNSTNWNTAYTYSQVGHLPLAGGTLTGTLNSTTGNYTTTTGVNTFTTAHGNIQLGPMNTTWAHIYTDRPAFYLNKEMRVNNNLVWNSGNDGSGSGLDADLLDGQHGSYYANESARSSVPSSGNYNTTNSSSPASLGTGYLRHDFWSTFGGGGSGYRSVLSISSYTSGSQWTQLAFNYNAGVNAPIYFRQNDYNGTSWGSWNQLWDSSNDGSGSGLDADLLDGVQGSSFLRSDTTDTASGFISLRAGGDHLANHSFASASSTSTGYSDAGIEVREGNYGSTLASAPRIGMHWGGRVASNISMDASGFITIRNNPGTAYESFRANNIYANGTNLVWNTGNDGSGSGLDADLLDGYNAAENGGNVVLKLASNGYSQINNWTQVGGAGLYSSAHNSAHISPNSTFAYGTWKIDGSRGGYSGLYLSNGGGVVVGMHDAGGNGGSFNSTNGWQFYWARGNACLGVAGSTTSSSYGLYEQGGGIYSTGNITAYSDRRVKENIRTIDNALETVEKMRGVYYNRIDDEEKKTVIGFIAQEVDEVEGAKPLVTYAEDVDQYGVSYGNTAALLVEAIKDLSQQVKDLQSEIKEMKNA